MPQRATAAETERELRRMGETALRNIENMVERARAALREGRWKRFRKLVESIAEEAEYTQRDVIPIEA